LLSPSAETGKSSVDKVNLDTEILPFPPLEALRSNSLLGKYDDCPLLADLSGVKAKTLSEKVLLKPASLAEASCGFGRLVKLADRGGFSVSSSWRKDSVEEDVVGDRWSGPCTDMDGKMSTSAPTENMLRETSSH
jgi:hypothetical protein